MSGLAGALWFLIGAVLGGGTVYLRSRRRAPRARLVIASGERVLINVPVTQLPHLAKFAGGTWNPFLEPRARTVAAIRIAAPLDIRVESP